LPVRTKTKSADSAGTFANFLAERTIAAGAIIHLLAGIAFVMTLAISAGVLTEEANASELPGCKGANLVEQLRVENPDGLATIAAEADGIENGNSIFWKISREGIRTSWLFGTMHSADGRILALMDKVRPEFEAASTIIVENTDSLDGGKMAKALGALKRYVFLETGATLDKLVPQSDLPALKEALASRQVPWAAARQMQPWLVTASIAIPLCESQAKSQGHTVLDTLIGTTALEEGKQLVGLESVEEQFKAVASIPFEFHINALKETLKLGDLSDDMMETTKALYIEGKPGWMLPLVRAFAPETYSGKGHAQFQELLLTNRNSVMAERAARYLMAGDAFMAVGALHLPGEQGLVSLLRKAGFTVEAVAL
jgi:uncharacterized protein